MARRQAAEAAVPSGIDGVVDLVQGRGYAFEEGSTRLGEADAARGPLQQPHADVIFELAQRLA